MVPRLLVQQSVTQVSSPADAPFVTVHPARVETGLSGGVQSRDLWGHTGGLGDIENERCVSSAAVVILCHDKHNSGRT